MAMEFDYDLVVLDLNLPGIDGLSVLKSLRQSKFTIEEASSGSRRALPPLFNKPKKLLA